MPPVILPSMAAASPRLVGICAAFVALLLSGVAAAQQPSRIDTSRIGPQVGQTVPVFSGTDQFGKRHSLDSLLGAKGLMLVFFRSADW